MIMGIFLSDWKFWNGVRKAQKDSHQTAKKKDSFYAVGVAVWVVTLN